jgi:hypothetical protein
MAFNVDAPKIGRIHAFDLLRGYFLVVILLNHLHYYPSGLDFLTGRGILYVSSAEGFFLISGIVLGIVRGRKLIAKPLAVASRLLLKRSWQLYVTFVVLTLSYTLIAWLLAGEPGLKAAPASIDTTWWQLLWQTLTFQYLYGWMDFLRLYIIFLLAAPLALWLLRRGWWHIMLAISFGVWALFPFSSQDYWAMPVSWQFVFFSGLAVGFHWPELTKRWHTISRSSRNIIGLGLFSTAIVTMIMSALLVYATSIGGSLGGVLNEWHDMIASSFNKDRLPLARLALGAIWFWGLFWLIRQNEDWWMRWFGWLFYPLGVNSLYVYIVQSALVFFAHLFILMPSHMAGSASWYVNLSLSISAITIIWLMVRYKVLFNVIPR